MNQLNLPDYQNIAIIRLSSLGDIIHTLPAFQLLRRHFPRAKINWFAELAGARLLDNFNGIDNIVTVNLKIRGLKNKIRELKKILNQYRNQFDLIIDFQGLLKSAVLSRLLRSPVIGFHRQNLKEPWARFFYNRKADYFDENRHVINKNIHLLHLLNISGTEIHYPKKNKLSSPRVKSFLQRHQLVSGTFIILNVGGGWESKLLDIEQYIEIAGRLKTKYPIVILWGNEKERQLAERISKSSQTIMGVYLEFHELFELIGHSALIITADTLAMHAADMMNVPSVGIFGPTAPARNGSLLKDSVSIYNHLDCSFCYKKKCDTMLCLKTIPIDKIEDRVSKIYEKYI